MIVVKQCLRRYCFDSAKKKPCQNENIEATAIKSED